MKSKSDKSNGSHEIVTDCIYTALLELMDKMPYSEIKITNIVNKAGVSRMAYYRNFKTKDDILLQKLGGTLSHFEELLKDYGNITEEEFWTEFFEAFRKNQVIQNIVRAGLIQNLMEAHKDFTIKIYTKIFHIDMDAPRNKMLVYEKMGCMVGLMLYNIENGNTADSATLAREVIKMSRVKINMKSSVFML